MMMNRLKPLSTLLLTLFVSACSSMPGSGEKSDNIGGTHFYSLSSMPVDTSSNKKLPIGIGPVDIPRLLNRPQIVSRKNSNEINLAEKHQWGGSYKEEIIQTLSDNLSSLLKTQHIERYPWKLSFKPNYQIRVDIERFDGELGKSVTLQARWRLMRGNKEVLVKQSVIQQAVNGKSYSAYVKAQSLALQKFATEISRQIK